MGADGGISIYKKSRLSDKFGKSNVDKFLDEFRSASVYVQELEKEEYITRYNGDNIQCYGFYEFILSCYNPTTKEINEQSYDYDGYYHDLFNNLSKSDRELFCDMIEYLENEGKVSYWEVWT